jgi:uncharacterized membrane protein YdcZ (DUF606 family)
MGCGLAFECEYKSPKENVMGLILLIILILILVGALPTWGYSSNWGYYPGGIVGTILIVVLILLLLGYL